MASMGGVNKHLGGYNVAKPKATPMGINPVSFARNNLSMGGVNKTIKGNEQGKAEKGDKG